MEKVFFQDKLNERRKFRASSFYRSLREIVTRAFEKKNILSSLDVDSGLSQKRWAGGRMLFRIEIHGKKGKSFMLKQGN